MVDESGEAKPAHGAPDTVSAAPSDAAAQLAIERGIPVPVQAPISSPEPEAPAAPPVGDPPPPAGEGDRREAVEGARASEAETAPTAPAPLAGALLPLLEFTAWRLLELAVTIGAAAFLTGLLLPAATAADPAILADRLGVTVPLALLSLLIAALVGLPLGYLSALIGGWTDVALRAVTTLGLALNPIWLAMLLVLLLATSLQWLQPGGFILWTDPVGALTSLLLPALALGLPLAAELATRMRDALTAILAGPAMRTADLRGYSRGEAIGDFALHLALARTFARLGVPLALLVPMSLVIEAVFYLPGLGRMIFTALAERDFATLQLGLVTLVALVALCRVLGLLLQAVFDPRIARRA